METPKMPYPERDHSLKVLWILVLGVGAIIYFVCLNGYPLLDPDEGRYAEISREMLETGDFITPRLNYVKYFEKPPLFYWLMAGAMALFGQHEWGVRIVPSVAGFGTLLLIMGMGKRFLGGRAGVMGAWVYLTSLVPLVLARLPIIDGLFSLFLTATWGAWWSGYTAPSSRKRRQWYCGAWACMGLATMTKGIAAIVLTGVIVLVFIILKRDWTALRSMAWCPGLLIFALIVFPWHLAVGFRDPEFAHFYFVVQHFGRILSDEHVKPFWFFPIIFPFGMLSWSGLFFPAAATALRQGAKGATLQWKPRLEKREEIPSQGGINGRLETRPHDAVLFLVIWIIAVLGLFSLSRCKLVPYILPAYPAMALLMGSYLTGGGLDRRSSRWCTALMAVLLLVPIPVVSYYAQNQDMVPISELAWPIRFAQAALLFGSVLLGLAFFRRRLIPFCTGLVLVAFIPVVITTVPIVVKYRKIGSLFEAMPRPLPAEVRIAEWRKYRPSVNFYARRRIILVDESGELTFGSTLGDHRDFFLQGKESLKRLAGEGPLLVNLRSDEWPEVRGWGTFSPVAANSGHIILGNEDFFRLTGLIPWPKEAVTSPPLLLMPRGLVSSKKD